MKLLGHLQYSGIPLLSCYLKDGKLYLIGLLTIDEYLASECSKEDVLNYINGSVSIYEIFKKTKNFKVYRKNGNLEFFKTKNHRLIRQMLCDEFFNKEFSYSIVGLKNYLLKEYDKDNLI